MTLSPSIIACGGLVFVTCRFPPGPVSELIPLIGTQDRIGVRVDVRATFDNKYFVVVVDNHFRPGHYDITEAAWDEKVREVIQHVWDVMRDRGHVDGTMPEIIKGNPLDMLPK